MIVLPSCMLIDAVYFLGKQREREQRLREFLAPILRSSLHCGRDRLEPLFVALISRVLIPRSLGLPEARRAEFG
jgi:hypothetical protein